MNHEIRTPLVSPRPRVNGPMIFAVRPRHPFFYAIPATGDRPMKFSVTGLPSELILDENTGFISGMFQSPGRYQLVLHAHNALGAAEKTFTVVVGEELALTPPLGWNSFPAWGNTGYSQDRTLKTARKLVSLGLDRHGYNYMNLDDGWQGIRGGPFNALQPDVQAFPDMKSMCDQLHAMGLKVGIYHTPWVQTYAGRCGGTSEDPHGFWDPKAQWPGDNPPNIQRLPKAIGRYSFVKVDVQQFAEWGFDYLKYDWNPIQLPETLEVANAVRTSGRDMILSLSNNHENTLKKTIDQIAPLAQSWRTTTDVKDNWKSIHDIGFAQDGWANYGRPGHWNDPDTLVIGQVRWGRTLHPSKLTPDEQYTQVTLWALLGGPFLIGCELEPMDAFTMGLITNDEILDVVHDTLGKQGVKIAGSREQPIYGKPLADGTMAIGLFNLSETTATVSVRWSDIKKAQSQRVFDLWRQKPLGEHHDGYSVVIAPHGAEMIRISPAN